MGVTKGLLMIISGVAGVAAGLVSLSVTVIVFPKIRRRFLEEIEEEL